jgi:hypothetical protein
MKTVEENILHTPTYNIERGTMGSLCTKYHKGEVTLIHKGTAVHPILLQTSYSLVLCGRSLISHQGANFDPKG